MQAGAVLDRSVWSIKEIAPCRNKERQLNPTKVPAAFPAKIALFGAYRYEIIFLALALTSGKEAGYERLKNEADTISRMNQSLMS